MRSARFPRRHVEPLISQPENNENKCYFLSCWMFSMKVDMSICYLFKTVWGNTLSKIWFSVWFLLFLTRAMSFPYKLRYTFVFISAVLSNGILSKILKERILVCVVAEETRPNDWKSVILGRQGRFHQINTRLNNISKNLTWKQNQSRQDLPVLQ